MRALLFVLLLAGQCADSLAVTSHQALLKWQASVTPGVFYRVLRGSATGGPYTMVASGISKLTWTDKTVVTKTTYYYVVNCKDRTTNLISDNSNEVKAVIP